MTAPLRVVQVREDRPKSPCVFGFKKGFKKGIGTGRQLSSRGWPRSSRPEPVPFLSTGRQAQSRGCPGLLRPEPVRLFELHCEKEKWAAPDPRRSSSGPRGVPSCAWTRHKKRELPEEAAG